MSHSEIASSRDVARIVNFLPTCRARPKFMSAHSVRDEDHTEQHREEIGFYIALAFEERA
jgi:hypothetical protein